MKLEQQTISLELARKLKELKVKQESVWVWQIDSFSPKKEQKWKLKLFPEHFPKIKGIEWISAFTVAELGEMLKESHIDIDYWYSYPDFRLKLAESNTSDARNEKEVEARGEMLIYLLENKLLT